MMKAINRIIYISPKEALKLKTSTLTLYFHQGKLSSYKFIGCQTLDPKEVYDLKARREA